MIGNSLTLLCLLQPILSLVISASTSGVLLGSHTTSIGVLKCILESGYSFASPLAVSTYSGLNTLITQELDNIKNANMEAEVIWVPCRGRDTLAEVQDFMTKVPKGNYRNIWLLADTASSDLTCHWIDDNIQLNVLKMVQVVTELKKNNITNVGMMANAQIWETLFQGSLLFKDLPLFWSPQQPNNDQNFSDYQPFGDWKSPAEKLYTAKAAVCGNEYPLTFSR